MEQRRDEGVETATVVLSDPIASTMESIWSWYPQFMFERNVALARARGDDLSKLVIDGNQKLSGRVCGRPVAELAHSHALGLYTATPCSLQPLYKKRRCSLHCTSAAPSAEPLAEEAIVAHRRLRVVMTEPCALPYEEPGS